MRIKLVSHNVYWFQGHPFQGDRPETADPRILKRLAALYLEQQADILCLQEIQSREVFNSIALAAKMKGAFAEGRVYGQYGGCVCTRHEFEPEPPADCEPGALERMALLCKVSAGQTALGIGNIHLTSGRQSGKDRAGAARLREMEGIFHLAGGKIDILCGDFNEHAGGGVSRFLEENGYTNAASLGGKREIASLAGCTSGGDQIWVRESMKDSVADYGVICDGFSISDVPGKKFLSDHLPVWIVVDV